MVIEFLFLSHLLAQSGVIEDFSRWHRFDLYGALLLRGLVVSKWFVGRFGTGMGSSQGCWWGRFWREFMLVRALFEVRAGNARGFWRETFCKGWRLWRLGSFANGSKRGFRLCLEASFIFVARVGVDLVVFLVVVDLV